MVKLSYLAKLLSNPTRNLENSRAAAPSDQKGNEWSEKQLLEC